MADDADHILGGSTINITDMDEDAKGKKFKKFEILSLGDTPSVSAEKEPAKPYQPAPQELGMWYKELGEMIRAKDIDTTKPSGKAMRTAYYAKMLSVLDIKIENK